MTACQWCSQEVAGTVPVNKVTSEHHHECGTHWFRQKVVRATNGSSTCERSATVTKCPDSTMEIENILDRHLEVKIDVYVLFLYLRSIS